MAQEQPADPPEDACGASGYSDLIGKNLAAVTLPTDLNARVIKPGDMVTQDFVPERLNIETNELGVIENLRCG
ncbi:hypothetical protein E0K89_009595 [Aquicoccus sp. SCR17]|nr:hypothetical protein [Carideicomes alvinocaridis]